MFKKAKERGTQNKKDKWKTKGKRQEGTRKGNEGTINDKSNMKQMEFRIGFRIKLHISHLVLNDYKRKNRKEKEQEIKEDATRIKLKHIKGIQNWMSNCFLL